MPNPNTWPPRIIVTIVVTLAIVGLTATNMVPGMPFFGALCTAIVVTIVSVITLSTASKRLPKHPSLLWGSLAAIIALPPIIYYFAGSGHFNFAPFIVMVLSMILLVFISSLAGQPQPRRSYVRVHVHYGREQLDWSHAFAEHLNNLRAAWRVQWWPEFDTSVIDPTCVDDPAHPVNVRLEYIDQHGKIMSPPSNVANIEDQLADIINRVADQHTAVA